MSDAGSAHVAAGSRGSALADPRGALHNLETKVASGDAFEVRRFQVAERMSSLFEVHLVAVCENPDVDFEDTIGHPMRFAMRSRQDRTWTGVCSQLQQIAVEEGGLSTYELTLVPTLWLTTQRRNYRMFQQKSEVDIVLDLLGEWGISSKQKLTGTYKKRKYRVQYGESDYAFLCRMLEDAGVSFYFDAESNESQLVLDDGPQGNAARAPIYFRDHPTVADLEHVTNVRVGGRVRPGKYTMRDHDYRRSPAYNLSASASGARGVEEQLERFHYTPGAFLFESEKGESSPVADDRGKYRVDEAEGAAIAQRRLDAKRASARVVSFETNTLDPAPGTVVSFLDHPRGELGPEKRHLVIESMLSGTHAGDWTHTCTAVSAETQYRPPLATPKPRAIGVESATVVGPAGEEIYTDEFGRVRVHFHWDRESKMNERSSCWVHVSQPWGGTGFGSTNLPRIGQEVIVDFLGGDPDRPIITGRVYTNLQKTPYKLPDNKTQSGWKSQSSPGGGAANYNEIMFEDKKGQELVRMQAEKDLNKLVKHDENVTIGNDRTKQVGHDDGQTVGHDRTRQVGHDESVTVGNDRTRMVGNNESIMVGNSRSMSVGVNESLFVGISQNETVGILKTETVGTASIETVGVTKTLTVGAAYTITVSGVMNTAVGGVSTEEVGKSKKVAVADKIELVCGQASIVMEKSGKIDIKGTEITVNGTQIVLTASGQAEMHGSAVKITGDPIDLN